jgi:hypothetical protein
MLSKQKSARVRFFSLLTACMLCALLCTTALAAGRGDAPGRPQDIVAANAAMENIFSDFPEPETRADIALIDKVHEKGRVPVIVRLREADLPYGIFANKAARRTDVIRGLQSEVLDNVLARSGRDENGLHTKRFKYIPAMALQVDADELNALLDNPNVIDIVEDVPVPLALSESVPLIGADPDGSFDGYTGDGWAVAILDTGVDKNHPFLNGKVVSEACYSSNVSGTATSLCPGGVTESTAPGSGLHCDFGSCNHGTHVAGITAGKGSTFSGVAKDADIIAIQVFTRLGTSDLGSYPSDQIKALERVYELRNDYQIASVNMSLGGDRFYSVCNSAAQKPAIDNLRTAGIATVIASANNGYTDSMGSPACISTAISVGSTTKQNAVSYFSNSADFLSLLAPGSSIYSCLPGGEYAGMSGTSMAAPHVAGAWAVLKQAAPEACVTAVLEALQDTGEPVSDTRLGAGNRVKSRIEVADALEALNYCETDGDCGELTPFCEEGMCVECMDATDCDDDGLFCSGEPQCFAGACVFSGTPCSGDTSVCDETLNRCVECLNNSDCNDHVFCNGVETCVAEMCISGTAPCGDDPDLPYCYEGGDSCVECTQNTHCAPGYRCVSSVCTARGTMRIAKANVKAGKFRGADRMKFSGLLSATAADLNTAMGGSITLSIEAETIPDPSETTFTFPINELTFKKGKYKSPKFKPAYKTDPVVKFAFDTIKGKLTFSSKNLDLTGVGCPITIRIEFGDYAAVATLTADIVNGKKPCPPELMMGVLDRLSVEKTQANKGSAAGSDSLRLSGIFTVEGALNPDLPVVLTLGPDTFSLEADEFDEKNGSYMCKKCDSGNGFVTAKFDTEKCRFSIRIKDADISGSGKVTFSKELFGNSLQTRVTLPPEF